MKKLLLALLLAASVAAFADCPDCGSNCKPQIIFRCKQCKKNFCNECAARFPGWSFGRYLLFGSNIPETGIVECECGATAKIDGFSCEGDIRILRVIREKK